MKTIPQRDLRNHTGEVLRQAEAGVRFTITVDGRPVAVLGPQPKRQWVSREELVSLLASLPPDPAFLDDVKDMSGTVEESEEDPWLR